MDLALHYCQVLSTSEISKIVISEHSEVLHFLKVNLIFETHPPFNSLLDELVSIV